MAEKVNDEDANIPEYRMPGRPPKAPKNIVRTPVRCLVTHTVAQAVANDLCTLHGVTASDVLRLALYNLFEKDGLLTSDLRKDATWDELRKQGLV